VSLLSVRGVARAMAAGALVIGAGIAAVSVAPVALADSTGSMESQFIAKMNAAREANGQRPYAVASDLTAVAREHSAQMAQRQTLYHNPDLTTQVQNWQAVGENVGEGPTVSDIHDAFMHSPEHRANILDHDFTQVGVGVTVDSNGIVWVTEDFREPMHSTTSTAPSRQSSPARHSTPPRHAAAPVRHASAPPATHRVATATPRVVHQASSPAPVATAAGAPVLTAPAQTPQGQLLARITAARTAAAAAPSGDPVSQAFDYLDAVTAVANG